MRSATSSEGSQLVRIVVPCTKMHEGNIEMQWHSQVVNGAKHHLLTCFDRPPPAQQATEPQAKEEVTQVYSLS